MPRGCTIAPPYSIISYSLTSVSSPGTHISFININGYNLELSFGSFAILWEMIDNFQPQKLLFMDDSIEFCRFSSGELDDPKLLGGM